MNKVSRIFFLFFTFYTHGLFACEEIEGTYSSFSETHWSFELIIHSKDSKLTYQTYWYGDDSLRVDERVVSEVICKKEANGYSLIFPNREDLLIKYHNYLSYSPIGNEGGSPGITGKFLPNIEVELWSKLPNT